MPRPRNPASLFRYFRSSPEVIRLVVLMYVRFPLSLRNVEDLLFERGIDICHETVRLGTRQSPGLAAVPRWWNRFGPLFAADIRRQRVNRMSGFRQWRWHVDEAYVTRRAAKPTLTARRTISGAPSIAKAKFWNLMSPKNETNRPLCGF
jgi:putative transposase